MTWSESLYTEVHCTAPPQHIAYGQRILMIGSCFSEHIAQRLRRYRYDVLDNPFGIVYNPVSVDHSLRRIEQQSLYQPSELIFHDHLYHSPDHHGAFSTPHASDTIHRINDQLQQAHHFLQSANHVILSLGSAIVYRYRETGQIVANCHKIPQTQFDSFRLSVDETIGTVTSISHTIRRMSPNAQVIWTVSPVRHMRHQLQENQLSKSTLLLAIDALQKERPEQLYFPAYEIMMDQLRDYRFYDHDLMHPSTEAIDIIWNTFARHYLRREDVALHSDIERIHRMIEHRPMHQAAQDQRAWIEKCLDKITDIEHRYPALTWAYERKQLQNRLP